MTEPEQSALPALTPGPSFAPKRGRRKPAEPNKWESAIASLAVDENGYSETQSFTVADQDSARAERKEIRQAVKTAGLGSKVQFKDKTATGEGWLVTFGIVPKPERKKGAHEADEAVEAPAEAAPAPAADPQVDF